MPPRQLIDSHVHLWPISDANTTSHSWMTPGHVLAKQFSVEEYITATTQGQLDLPEAIQGRPSNISPDTPLLLGIVYIETDRALPPPAPELGTVARWTHPLAELAWLRRLVDGTPEDDEGHEPAHSSLLLGLIPWAPVNEGAEVMKDYLTKAKEVLGAEAWNRVKGWRFLLQGMTNREEFERVVLGKQFASGLRMLGRRRGWVFDVGVDEHSGGVWQLEGFATCAERIREDEKDGLGQITFVLNHLCKPTFERSHFSTWAKAMHRLSMLPGVYVKLSGCFSQAPTSSPFSADDYYEQIQPWIRTILKLFQPKRIMFGSDWPVCTIGGPRKSSWASWQAVVEEALDSEDVDEDDQEWIWWRTAAMAYRLGPYSDD